MPENYRTYLGAISLCTAFFTYFFYCRDIFRGSTKPHAFTWLIWAVLSAIAFFGQRSDFAGPGAWMTGFVAIAATIIFFLALIYGDRNIAKFDWGCLIFSLLAIPLWLISKTALWSMLYVTLIDSVGFLPTIRKTWSKPREETVITYVLSALNYFLSFLALDNSTLTTAFYPIIVSFMNLLLVAIALWRRKNLV